MMKGPQLARWLCTSYAQATQVLLYRDRYLFHPLLNAYTVRRQSGCISD